jgi:hypothetical protein
MKPTVEGKAPVRRFVHLGDRLLAIGRVQSGTLCVEDAARELNVPVEEILHWLAVHGSERTVTFGELRQRGSPEVQKLSRRAARLADLVAQAERLLRELHNELTSKQFVENPHLRALRVVHAQPHGE